MVLSKNISTKILLLVLFSTSLGIFLIDLQTPLGIADGFSYIAVMLLSMWGNNKRLIIFSAVLGIVFTVSGYFLSPPAAQSSEPYIAITNRIVSIIVLALCAFLLIKYKVMELELNRQHHDLQILSTELKSSNAELEEQVKERTKVLEDALNSLVVSKLKLNKSLEHEKELNELKSRFVSMASHEFRTPLATILSSLSLVSTYSKQGEKEKLVKHIHRIKSSVNHLTDLLTDILSLTKLEEGKINVSSERIRIKDFVAEIISEMQAIANSNQIVIYEHKGSEEIVVDKKILRHILLNLISNAIKFSQDNVLVKTNTNESVFSISVEDKGIGIPIEDQKYLFERFYRGSNASEIQGTGLGLNIVERYVKLLNGKITFISKIEEGTKFTIEFPIEISSVL